MCFSLNWTDNNWNSFVDAILKYNETRGKMHDDDEAIETTLYDGHRTWDR